VCHSHSDILSKALSEGPNSQIDVFLILNGSLIGIYVYNFEDSLVKGENMMTRKTLEACIRSGECKMEDKRIRCASKGITDITTVTGSERIEQLFISSNFIESLDGVQSYINLKVLSISFNQISAMSELQYLKNLQLQALNMEGNPITRLPFYSSHVVALLPTLEIFDAKSVTSRLRSQAKKAVEFDQSRLSDLLINEMRLRKLRSLSSDHALETNWLKSVQQALGPLTMGSFGMNDADIAQEFDILRRLALDFRGKHKQRKTMKWAEVYDELESVQKHAIDELTANLEQRIKISRESLEKKDTTTKTPSRINVSDGNNQSPVPQMKIFESPKTAFSETSVISPVPQRVVLNSEPHREFDFTAVMIRLNFRSKMRRILQSWRSVSRCPRYLNTVAMVFARGKDRTATVKAFYSWKCNFLKNQRKVYEKGELIEQVQVQIAKVSELETEIEHQQKSSQEIQAALEQSVKNEEKMKRIVQKTHQEKKVAERNLKESEKRYEEDLLQFMLESKFKHSENERRFAELEESLRKSESERISLNRFIK
jgi:hypothetical protein